jgi:hypothetical protein
VTLDINSLLLLTELVLLIPTLLLLIFARREEKGRSHLLHEITRTAKMLSRQEYFSYVLLGMQTATKSIRGSIKGSPPTTTEQEQFVEKVIEQLRLARKNRSVIVQYLMPKAMDRLSVAYRYREGGAEVRFHPSLVVSDVRYTVIDGKYNVIGLPSAVAENAHTGEGYMIVSEGLAEIFLDQFSARWSDAIEYDNYARTILSEITHKVTNISVGLLSTELKIPEAEVRRLLESGQQSNLAHDI